MLVMRETWEQTQIPPEEVALAYTGEAGAGWSGCSGSASVTVFDGSVVTVLSVELRVRVCLITYTFAKLRLPPSSR